MTPPERTRARWRDPRRRPRGAGAWLVATLAACSAPATLSELKTAEARARDGDVPGALAAYHAAQARCGALTPPRRARAACADALLGEAELLEAHGRTADAIAAYLALPARAPDDPTVAATATYRAGGLLLPTDATAAWTALWRVVTDWPDEPVAGDAVRRLLEDGRGRDARALTAQLAALLTPLAESQVADNLLWTLADLAEHELGDPPAALGYLDRIPVDHPDSGLRDDARWHAARIARALGDPRGAARRLEALLATREVALGVGSYFSIWLDDAQLELGRIRRDDLGDLPGAAAAFRQLPADYPASILRDDAAWELAVTLDRAGDRAGACAALAALSRLAPDGKFTVGPAVPLRARLTCEAAR